MKSLEGCVRNRNKFAKGTFFPSTLQQQQKSLKRVTGKMMCKKSVDQSNRADNLQLYERSS
jgi:hypothetical protein